MNKKTILMLTLTAFCWMAGAVETSGKTYFPSKRVAYPGGHYSIFRLQLKDKKGSAYNLRHPERFLSERALKRRERQGLKVDSTDLPLSEKYLKTLRKTGFDIIGGSKWNNTVLVKLTDTTALARLAPLKFVTGRTLVFTAPDSIRQTSVDSVVNDTTLAGYHSKSLYGKASHQIEMLNGQKLHAAGFRGEGMLIAIIDGGYMNADKIGLLKNVKVLGSRDCVYPYNANIYQLLDHGTMVLSTMASRTDSIFVGTAPMASYYLLRSEDGRTENLCEEDWWAQAAEAADSIGADVVNSSLGYTKFDDGHASHRYREQNGHTALISRTASLMAQKGMILVNSAGNDGQRDWKRINFPGDAENILTVAALKSDSLNASFSSVGPSTDGRVKPDVSAMGLACTVIRGNGKIMEASGTSFSSPELCGMVACLWEALPNKTATEIMDLVRRSGDRWQWPDNVYGYGIPDFWKAYTLGKQK